MPKTTPTFSPTLDDIARTDLVALVLRGSAPRDALHIWVEIASQAAEFLADTADDNQNAIQHGAPINELYGPSINAQAALIGFAVRVIGVLTECTDRQHRAAQEAAA